MKISSLTISALALALALPAHAQIGATAARVEPLRPIKMDTPVFPQRLLEEGFRDGDCRVAIGVNRDGKLDDILPIEYTNRAFADVTVAAVKEWTFEPAKLNGVPVAAATEIDVKFSVEGTVVVSVTSYESLSARIHSMILGNPDLYRPRTLHELDRIPTPITTTTPHYPKRLAQPGSSAHVAVTFFIDENGAVRLPSVDEDQDPELSALAIEALRSWKFEPATCKGRPVLVQATQTFTFHAPAKATASNN